MRYLAIIIVSLSLAFLLGACGSSKESAPTYTVGGTVSGLEGSGLTLQINDGDDLTVAENGPFAFTAPITDGANYVVTVLTQPVTPAQTCSVSSGSGSVAGADVTDVSIECGDRYEPNESCTGTAAPLATIDEGAPTLLYGNMTIYPAGDQDWYRVYAKAGDPTLLCGVGRRKTFFFTVTMTPPAGKDYDLQVCSDPSPYVFYPCYSTPSPYCWTSEKSSDAEERIQISWDEDCMEADDRYISILVWPYQGAASDAPYSLTLSFQ